MKLPTKIIMYELATMNCGSREGVSRREESARGRTERAEADLVFQRPSTRLDLGNTLLLVVVEPHESAGESEAEKEKKGGRGGRVEISSRRRMER
jgi:hypothetical protein